MINTGTQRLEEGWLEPFLLKDRAHLLVRDVTYYDQSALSFVILELKSLNLDIAVKILLVNIEGASWSKFARFNFKCASKLHLIWELVCEVQDISEASYHPVSAISFLLHSLFLIFCLLYNLIERSICIIWWLLILILLLIRLLFIHLFDDVLGQHWLL